MTNHVPVIKPITTHPTSSKSMMIHSSFVPVNPNPLGPPSLHSQIQSKSVVTPSTCIPMLNNSTATLSTSTSHFTMQTKSMEASSTAITRPNISVNDVPIQSEHLASNHSHIPIQTEPKMTFSHHNSFKSKPVVLPSCPSKLAPLQPHTTQNPAQTNYLGIPSLNHPPVQPKHLEHSNRNIPNTQTKPLGSHSSYMLFQPEVMATPSKHIPIQPSNISNLMTASNYLPIKPSPITRPIITPYGHIPVKPILNPRLNSFKRLIDKWNNGVPQAIITSKKKEEVEILEVKNSKVSEEVSLEFKKVMDKIEKVNKEEYNKQPYNKVTVAKHGHADEKANSKEKSFETLEIKDKTRPVFLKQELPNCTKNKNATVRWSSLCLNVVICPFCKAANWGHKQYQDHLKIYHSAQEIQSKVLKKAVNYMNYKFTKISIPRTPKYKNWQIPPRMIYNYKSHVCPKPKINFCEVKNIIKQGQHSGMANHYQSPIYLGPDTTLEPFENKIQKQGDINPIIKPILSIKDTTIKGELIESPKLFKNTKNFVSDIATKQANLITQKLPDMPELIPLQKSKTITPSSLRLIRPWEDSEKRKTKDIMCKSESHVPLKKRRLMYQHNITEYNEY